jgi:hypothetical protein
MAQVCVAAGASRRVRMSGPRLGFVVKVHMCECSVFSGDLKNLPNPPITAQKTGHFSTLKLQPRSTHAE